MAWILLILGGVFEVGFTTCLGKLKGASGTEAFWWFIGFLVSCSLSMYLLYKATSIQVSPIPIGTGYAIWAGIGAVGTALMGMFFFKEPADFWRIFFLFTLIASIVGLKFVSH